MAFKDQKKALEYNAAYSKETYSKVTICVRKDSETWDALQECKAHTGISYSSYALMALENQLRKDGYLPET